MACLLSDVPVSLSIEPDSESRTQNGANARRDLKALYMRHGGAVYDVGTHLCGPDRAPEVATEVFVELWTADQEDIFDGLSLRCALSRLCYQRSLDGLSSQEVREKDLNSISGRPERGTERERSVDGGDCFGPALRRLTRLERSALVVVHYGKCTCSEAAVVLGMEVDSVASLIRSGMKKLHFLVEL